MAGPGFPRGSIGEHEPERQKTAKEREEAEKDFDRIAREHKLGKYGKPGISRQVTDEDVLRNNVVSCLFQVWIVTCLVWTITLLSAGGAEGESLLLLVVTPGIVLGMLLIMGYNLWTNWRDKKKN